MLHQAKKPVNYAVDKSSDEDDDDDAFNPTIARRDRGRPVKRRKTSLESDADDVFLDNVGSENDVVDEGRDPAG